MKKSYDRKFKSRVAIEALRGEQTIVEIAGKYQVHPNQVMQWKKRRLDGSADIFTSKAEKNESKNGYDEERLLKKIGRLEVENDFLRKAPIAKMQSRLFTAPMAEQKTPVYHI